LLIENLKLY